MIRKLSGADNKDEKVGQQDIGPLNIEQNQVPDYLEATIYDKDNAVIMVRPYLT